MQRILFYLAFLKRFVFELRWDVEHRKLKIIEIILELSLMLIFGWGSSEEIFFRWVFVCLIELERWWKGGHIFRLLLAPLVERVKISVNFQRTQHYTINIWITIIFSWSITKFTKPKNITALKHNNCLYDHIVGAMFLNITHGLVNTLSYYTWPGQSHWLCRNNYKITNLGLRTRRNTPSLFSPSRITKWLGM